MNLETLKIKKLKEKEEFQVHMNKIQEEEEFKKKQRILNI
jgi:hypothetical protein